MRKGFTQGAKERLVTDPEKRYQPVMVVKRYSNRRLYDTDASRYVTLEEVAERIRLGEEVQFVDAPTGADITHGFLAQIVLEGRGGAKLMPTELLYKLVRLGDDALGDFFGRYMAWALDVYLKMRQGTRTMAAANPLAAIPLAASEAFFRWLGGVGAAPQAPRTSPPAWGRSPIDAGYGAPPASSAPFWGAPPPPDGSSSSAYWSPPGGLGADDLPPPPPVEASDVAPASAAAQSPDDQRQDEELAALRAELMALKEALGKRPESRGRAR